MKVLLICNFKPGTGGISGQVETLQCMLRREGHIADIFSTKASTLRRLLMAPKLRRVAADYDVLHIHCCSGFGFLPAVLGVQAGRSLGKRTVLTYHGGGAKPFFAKHKCLVHRYLTRTDANIVLSGFLGKVFDRHGLRYTVIPNITELDGTLFRQRDVLKANYICTRAHEPLYNIPCILRAFGEVQAARPEATLTLVGGGSDHERLKLMAQDMGLRNVTFTGRVDNSEIYRQLDHADIFLSAPTIDNMPVSILEAMNAGLPVISSRVGGVPYMIDDGRTGLLFDSDNHRELAAKMLWITDNQTAAKAMVQQARSEADRYRWENIRDKIYTVYGLHS